MGGGEINIIVTANIILDFEYQKPEASPIKNTVRVTTDSSHVSGVGAGTSTNRYHRGKDNIEFRVAEAVNDANNKAIIYLNQFVDANLM